MARRKKHTQLAVLEGRWKDDSNISVRGLFDLLSDIHCRTPHGYHYEMFCDRAALKNMIDRVADDDRLHYVYIGAHGDEDGIFGSDDTCISRQAIKGMFKNWLPGTVDGLYLGTCLFGHETNADYLLNPANPRDKPPFKWVAGYENAVDWIDSSALDLLFWNTFLDCSDTLSPLARIKATAAVLNRQAPGLVKDLGFQVFVRHRGGVRGLLDPAFAALDLTVE